MRDMLNLKNENKMKNLKIDFLNDDIFEIESILDKIDLPETTISGICNGHKWETTLKKYVWGTIDKIQQLDYDIENALYEPEELLDGDDFTQDDIDELIKEYESDIEAYRIELKEILTKL